MVFIMQNRIVDIIARQILDSRGNPTIETTVYTENAIKGVASVPSGLSKGSFEAFELRDNNPKYYRGNSVLKAVLNINDCISRSIIGQNVFNQYQIDNIMIELDSSKNKRNLGANSILSVSLACARAASNSLDIPLFRYIGGIYSHVMPIPMINVLNGGVHSDNGLDFQEFMIVPFCFNSFSDAISASNDVYYKLKEILQKKGYTTSVGDEGGFSPDIDSNELALELLTEAIIQADYDTDKFKIAVDLASTQFYSEGYYNLEGQNLYLNSSEFCNYLVSLTQKFPIISLEDSMAENDIEGWKMISEALNEKMMIISDDLTVTDYEKINNIKSDRIANSILIKPNQTGTLTETLKAIEIAKNNNYKVIISNRSGETADTFISDLAVGVNSGFIKTGSLSRSERTEKYNRLLKIESELKNNSLFNQIKL